LLALHGLLLLEVDLRIEKPFPLSPFTFVPDDEGKYIHRGWKRRIISTSADWVIHQPRASACEAWQYAVHKCGG
jgi:hypothetical protein